MNLKATLAGAIAGATLLAFGLGGAHHASAYMDESALSFVSGGEVNCDALSQDIMANPNKIGPHAYNADGSPINNSCIVRENDNRDPAAYDFWMVRDMVVQMWLLRPNGEHCAVEAVGPGDIVSPFGESRATIYVVAVAASGIHGIPQGYYAAISGSGQVVGRPVPFGTDPCGQPAQTVTTTVVTPPAAVVVVPQGCPGTPTSASEVAAHTGTNAAYWTALDSSMVGWKYTGPAVSIHSDAPQFEVLTPGYPAQPGLPAGQTETVTAASSYRCF